MTLSIEKIDEWQQGDSIEVDGILCRNPQDAWIVHIGNFYVGSDEPVNPEEDAIKLFDFGWVSSDQWEEDDLIEFLEDNKDELK